MKRVTYSGAYYQIKYKSDKAKRFSSKWINVSQLTPYWFEYKSDLIDNILIESERKLRSTRNKNR